MTKSSIAASRVAMEFDGVHACADVTGFGLVGHLLEMLEANGSDGALSSIGACLNIRDIPFYQGGLEASERGIFSTLQTQNARNCHSVSNHTEVAEAFPVEYPLFFDPQTAGGLLFFVDPDVYDEFLLLLQAEKVSATVIGEVEEYRNGRAIDADGVCTLGSGDAATGQRIRIAFEPAKRRDSTQLRSFG
jgi:selenide,water dikinase